jgi:hypothetical protein
LKNHDMMVVGRFVLSVTRTGQPVSSLYSSHIRRLRRGVPPYPAHLQIMTGKNISIANNIGRRDNSE